MPVEIYNYNSTDTKNLTVTLFWTAPGTSSPAPTTTPIFWSPELGNLVAANTVTNPTTNLFPGAATVVDGSATILLKAGITVPTTTRYVVGTVIRSEHEQTVSTTIDLADAQGESFILVFDTDKPSGQLDSFEDLAQYTSDPGGNQPPGPSGTTGVSKKWKTAAIGLIIATSVLLVILVILVILYFTVLSGGSTTTPAPSANAAAMREMQMMQMIRASPGSGVNLPNSVRPLTKFNR